ncbi:MAG: extracellular solute-binding protein [Candidatus Nanopelagicales bacterium]|nr:extracellular solute-binding protein [Candidatus Nanopelagicales bacterium]
MHHSRLLKMAVATSAAALLLAACGGSSDDAGTDAGAAPGGDAYAGPVGDGEGALSVLAWPGYAEDGSTDPAVDWVTPFEEATGCAVDVKVFGTSDEAVKLMQGGGYDVISASGDASLRLIYGENVQPVNMDLVPNYADIFPDLKDRSHNTVAGASYGVPHGRGANLLIWDKEKVGESVDSWSIMFEPDSPAAGGVGPYDSPIYIADAAVYLMATQPDLGITDPYSLDQTQFDAAIALLQQQKPLVGEYWNDYLKQIDAVNAGTMTGATSWQVIVNGFDPDVVGSTKAKEGATGWSDTWMIAKDTANINCAYKWLDWMASPETNAQAAEWFGEAPANAKACDLTADPAHCETYHAGDTAYWEDVYYWNTPTEDCLDGRTDTTCVPYSEWSKAWSELRS